MECGIRCISSGKNIVRGDKEMNKKQEKKITIGLVVCFVAMVAVVGVITMNRFQKEIDEQSLVKNEEKENETAQTTNIENIISGSQAVGKATNATNATKATKLHIPAISVVTS